MEKLYCRCVATFYIFECIDGIVSRIDKKWNQMTDQEREKWISPLILEKDSNDPYDKEIIMPISIDTCSDKCQKISGE